MEYLIHSVARGRGNRTARAGLPQNPRMKQYIGASQSRLVRARPLVVSEKMVMDNITELRTKAAAHVLELRTRDGRLVDLETLTPGRAPPSPPLPHPLLDSVANDKNFKMPPGFKFIPPYMSDETSMTQVLPDGEKPALLKEAELPEPIAPVVAAPISVAATELAVPVGEDADLDAALAAAQAEAAPTEADELSSEEDSKKGKRNRR